MKSMIIAGLLAGATMTAATAQTQGQGWNVQPVASTGSAPAVAPAIPLQKAGDAVPTTTTNAPEASTAVGRMAEGNAPIATHADHWDDLPDTSRYLMIMGSVDGFASAGPGAPCFPGQNNSTLDEGLKKAGFGQKDPDALPEALTKLAASKDQCQSAGKRGYSNDLLKTMPDPHLATYLTGLIRSYARIKPCPAETQGYAAAMVTTAVFASPSEAQPIDVIAPALAEGCKGMPTK